MSDEFLLVGAPMAAAGGASRAVALTSSRLLVQAVDDHGTVFLEAHDRSDSTRSFLLALAHRPVIEAISSFTPLGRMHAICWGLAFGVGSPSPGAQVRFESGTLRHATMSVCVVRPLADDCWVADAEGVFGSAVLLEDGQERARTWLAPRP